MDKSKKRKNLDAGLFELLGSYQTKMGSQNKFDYNEIEDQMQEVTSPLIQQKIEEAKNSDEPRCNNDYNEMNSKSIDWRKGSFESEKYSYGCFTLFLLSFLSFFTGIIYYEVDSQIMYYKNWCLSKENCDLEISLKNPNEPDTSKLQSIVTYKEEMTATIKISLIFILIMSSLCEVAYVAMRAEYLTWKKTIRHIPEYETFFKSRSFGGFLFQCVLLFVQPYYFLNDIDFTYTVTGSCYFARINYLFLTLFFPIRMWHMIKYLIINSYFYSPRAQRLSKMFGKEISTNFAVKCIISSSPWIVILIGLGIDIFLGGYLIRIWERINNSEFDSYINCIWYCFITMTTVGYGEYYAASIFARMLIVFVGICGIFITSILTFVMTNAFTFSGGELKAFEMLNQIELRESLEILTKDLAIVCGRYFVANKNRIRASTGDHPNKEVAVELENKLTELEYQRKEMFRSLHDLSVEISSSESTDYVDFITDRISDVQKSVTKIKEIISQFSRVLDTGNENQRNLESLKNTLYLQNEQSA